MYTRTGTKTFQIHRFHRVHKILRSTGPRDCNITYRRRGKDHTITDDNEEDSAYILFNAISSRTVNVPFHCLYYMSQAVHN